MKLVFCLLLLSLLTLSLGALSYTTIHTIGEVSGNMVRWHHDRMQTSIGLPVDLLRWGKLTLLALPQLTTANFSAGEGLPWQSWNGHFGLASLWSLDKYNSELLFGYAHRADHVSDHQSYQKKFLISPDVWVNNRSLRSYEYFFLQYDKKFPLPLDTWRLDLTSNLRLFTPPLNPDSPYAQKASLGGRLVLVKSFGNRRELFQSCYTEYLWLDYDQFLGLYRPQYQKPPVFALGVELGVRLPLRKTQLFQFAIGYRQAPGRFFDFVEYIRGVDINASILTVLDEPITVLEGF